ncbi:cytosol aminopeptidase [bacterium BMS3Bbin12]|nr:cytosol aminopeptidase [bacterium BMS3Abin12]GBE47057.1 cytosol aminopeptidase [bacterium BMS3Bbin12]GBE49462.1 cytosol aminopeptidase [bacterium BMS3Bbin13]HDJ85796.1 leucyl aminopeptidase [Chromatiales bacterium]HDK02891.1 leucyl aminopeptidase [Gammaproteobacteria bacterium]
MDFSVKSGNPEKQRTACVVVGVFERRRLSAAAGQLDQASGGRLSNLLRRGDLEGRSGQTLLVHNLADTLCDRVLLVGCGREREFDERRYRKAVGRAVRALNETGAMEAVCYLTELTVKGRERDTYWRVRQAVETAEDTLYRFDRLKSEKSTERRPLRRLVFGVPSRRELAVGERAAREGAAIAAGAHLARDLGNLPANICTPAYLADEARTLAKSSRRMKVEVLERADMEKLGMGALLAVARGSRQPPKLVVLQYSGGTRGAKPVVLVGKGITFDSGGISIKPSAAMDEMKFDMCGAAGVLGALKVCVDLQLPLNVVGVIVASENLPDGDASKPGDVVTSLSGQTIEILNTDAEGRLVLCDALTYCERFGPEAVVDLATLTGACVVALGKHASGLLGNHAPLAHDLLNAGRYSGDRTWELPLWDEYQDQLKSNFADMANVGGRDAGTITAACFLSRFTKKYHWAHLDIAGVAWKSGKRKGATGRPVPLLAQYLLDRCEGRGTPARKGRGAAGG